MFREVFVFQGLFKSVAVHTLAAVFTIVFFMAGHFILLFKVAYI